MKRGKGSIKFITIKGIDDFQIVYGEGVVNSFPIHIHEKYCIGAIEKGNAVLEIKNMSPRVGRGSVYLINPGEAHLIRPFDSEGFSHIVLSFGDDFIKKYFDREDKLVFSESVVDNNQLSERIIDFAHQLFDQEQEMGYEFRLFELLDEVQTSTKPLYEEHSIKNYQQSIQEVCRYINSNPASNMSLEALSKRACLSRFHFCRLFKSVTGISPYDYQIQRRVKRARIMLLEKKPIAEIVLELGFADQSHFTRFFKKNTGVTPSGYVKSNIRL